MRSIRCYILVTSIVALILTTAVSCSREDSADNGCVTLRAGAYLPGHTLIETRALPSGYNNYSNMYPDATQNQADIKSFLMTVDGTYDVQGVFQYDTDVKEWTFSQQVRTGISYYVYGVMPLYVASNATIVPSSGSYANGAVLSVPAVGNVIRDDLNVIVGVRRRMGTSDNIEDASSDLIQPGSFVYTAPYTDVYMHILLDHIYAKLTVNFSIDENYDKLRTIQLTQCVLKTTTGPSTFDIEIPLTANATGADPVGTVTYSKDAVTTGGGAVLNMPEEGITLTTDMQSVEAYLCPDADAVKNLDLETTYNVYDKSGNLIREDCVVTNSISVNATGRGQAFVLNAVVSPTYLYQLSSPDFDTPNIKLK